MRWHSFHFIVEETEINLTLPLPNLLYSRKDILGMSSDFPKVTLVVDGKPDT